MLAISLDTDWAPDEVLYFALDFLLSYPIKLTIFATHDTPVLKGLDKDRVEIGIHPNFRPIPLDDLEACRRKITELLEIYPEAKGVRCHSLVNSTPLMDLFAQTGLKYENNLFFPTTSDLRPYRIWNGLVRIPLFWEDDLHCMYGWGFDVPPEIVSTNGGVRVFNVHPPQLFMNIEQQSRYLEAKPYYHQPDKLREFGYDGPGIRTFMADLCSLIVKNNLSTYKLQQIADATPDRGRII